MRDIIDAQPAPDAACVPERRLQHRRQQRGGHALARHVGDREQQAVVAERDDVVEVAAHLLARQVRRVHVEALARRELLEQERLLDAACKLQLALRAGARHGVLVEVRGERDTDEQRTEQREVRDQREHRASRAEEAVDHPQVDHDRADAREHEAGGGVHQAHLPGEPGLSGQRATSGGTRKCCASHEPNIAKPAKMNDTR
jgi:hypothetical protein